MIVKRTPYSNTNLILPTNSLIIDIETTGFSPKYASVYMIGFIEVSGDGVTAEQWLCEKEADEYELLYKLQQRLTDTPLLYHFNGDRFDLPFLIKRMGLYDMKFPDHRSCDIMKLVRPYKKRLGLEDLKLKSVEKYFGYDRFDPFTGGDLIAVYQDYLTSHDSRAEEALFTHNYEDILGLGDVLVHLPLFQLLDNLRAGEQAIVLTESLLEEGFYKGRFETPEITGRYHFEDPHFELTLEDKEALLKVPVQYQSANHYFPDYKDYYYLFNEGYAVHKSIGKFVAKDHRVQATKDTAFVSKEGFFLPDASTARFNFSKYYKPNDRKAGFNAVEDLVEAEAFNGYIQALLTRI